MECSAGFSLRTAMRPSEFTNAMGKKATRQREMPCTIGLLLHRGHFYRRFPILRCAMSAFRVTMSPVFLVDKMK
jgi:hypothetical protein